MHHTPLPVLGFAAYSGTGKTTLLTQLIPLLTQHRLKIGLIKHSHHSFEIDKPGKDSYRLRAAGASTVVLASKHRRAIITEIVPEREPKLADQVSAIEHDGLDLILVEGFKAERFPKIELHRPSLKKPLLYPYDQDIIAVASDGVLALPEHLTALDINDPGMIAEFILTSFMGHTHV
ncbi:MAG: molybdopterin-guanine dinucleotide biosynthesis protein B [Gammaproteobacteria bacterium]